MKKNIWGKFPLFMGMILILIVTGYSKERVVISTLLEDGYSGIDKYSQYIKSEISNLLAGEFDVTFSDDIVLPSNKSDDFYLDEYNKLENDTKVNFILIFSNNVVHSIVASKKELSKMTFAPMVTEGEILNLKDKKIKNFYPTKIFPDFNTSVKSFSQLVDKDTIGAIINSKYRNLKMPATIDSVAIKYIFVSNGDLNDSLVKDSTLPIFLSPLLSIKDSVRSSFIQNCLKRKIPVFSVLGITDLYEGAIMTQTDSSDFMIVARSVAMSIQSAIIGEKLDSTSITVPFTSKNIINKKSAVICGIDIPWMMLSEARIINKNYTQTTDSLSLVDMIKQSVESNIELLMKKQEVQAGDQDLKSAWANYIPSLNLQLGYKAEDSASTVVDFGSAGTGTIKPQNIGYFQGNIEQLIFSDKINTQVAVQRRLRDARQEDLKATVRDISMTAANAFIALLKAQKNLEIKESEYNTIYNNLQVAYNGYKVGTTNPADVYRLETEVAIQKHRVFSARSLIRISKFNVNKILNRPIEQDFIAVDNVLQEGISDSLEVWANGLKTASDLDTFKVFLKEMALANSPELKSAHSYIEAKNKEKKEYLRGLVVPSLYAGFTYNDGITATPSDFETNGAKVGLYANWDIINNGEKFIKRKKANYELSQLTYGFTDAQNSILQDVSNSIDYFVTMISKVKLYNQAAISSDKNYAIIEDAYSRGAVDIERLLGAQNSNFQAQTNFYKSVYEFRESELALAKSINRLDYFTDKNFEDILGEYSVWLDKRAATQEQEKTAQATPSMVDSTSTK